MFKSIGNAFQGINSIAEGARKKRDGRKFIALAEATQRNFKQQDLVNNAAQIKISGEATQKALENINLNASQAFSQAADAGIRGIGMIGKIQQNVNSANQAQVDRLAEREFGVQQAKAAEQSQIRSIEERRSVREQDRSDAQLERGQALRSQGAAEVGQGVSATGGAVDSLGRDISKAAAGGGVFATDSPDAQGVPDLANTQFNPDRFRSFANFRRQ